MLQIRQSALHINDCLVVIKEMINLGGKLQSEQWSENEKNQSQNSKNFKNGDYIIGNYLIEF